MKTRFLSLLATFLFFSTASPVTAQNKPADLHFTVSMENPAAHYFHVSFRCSNLKTDSLKLYMPAWSPGYYQLLNYAKNVERFSVVNENGNALPWYEAKPGNWLIATQGAASLTIKYDVKATVKFVAQSFLDETHGYLIPAATFLYIEGQLYRSALVTVESLPEWPDVATGLDIVPGKKNTYVADDFDVLFDCPILIGKLEELPRFEVGGKPHRFIGYQLGNFDRLKFMDDLKKVVEGASGIIGDIPYKHYTFLAIGPGRGGIEHLNSTTISFDGSQLNTPEGRTRMLSFIAHEYFHHYNVKRIRPIELGPFDYQNGGRTRSLWVSEGLSVYYEYIVLKRMGLMTNDEFWNALRNNMMNVENKPGRLYQSVAQASYETWSDGPFGRTGDEMNKTISYYDKGPVLGLLLDLKLRHQTKNKRSLDDVMRYLYKQYYQKKKRGFTEEELKAACEKIAGTGLTDFFEYVNTVKEIDYPSYFAYAGLQIDTAQKEVPGAWLGINTRNRNDSVLVTSVDWNSPAWNSGIRMGDKVMSADGKPVNKAAFDALLNNKKTGEKIRLGIIHNNILNTYPVELGKKRKRNSSSARLMRQPDCSKRSFTPF